MSAYRERQICPATAAHDTAQLPRHQPGGPSQPDPLTLTQGLWTRTSPRAGRTSAGSVMAAPAWVVLFVVPLYDRCIVIRGVQVDQDAFVPHLDGCAALGPDIVP